MKPNEVRDEVEREGEVKEEEVREGEGALPTSPTENPEKLDKHCPTPENAENKYRNLMKLEGLHL